MIDPSSVPGKLFLAVLTLVLGALLAQIPGHLHLTVLMWAVWIAASVACLVIGRVALPGLALLATVLFVYVAPATYHSLARVTSFAGYDLTAGHALAEGVVILGILGVILGISGAARAEMPPGERNRDLQGKSPYGRASKSRQAVVAVGLLFAGGIALYLFGRLAGANFAALNVFAEDVLYGDFQREATGPRHQILNSLASVAGGAALISALMAFENIRVRSVGMVAFSSAVFVSAVVFLSLGGQRQRLIVPLIAMAFLFVAWSRTRMGSYVSVAVFSLGVGIAIFVIGNARSPVSAIAHQSGSPGAKVALNQDLFAPLSGLVYSVPHRVEFLFGLSYAEFFVMPIPRAWFPDKPTGAFIDMQSTFLPAAIGASSGQFGELYGNFGWVGVFVGSALLGWSLTRVWCYGLRLCSANRRHPQVIISMASVAILLQVATRSNAATQVFGQLGFILGVVAGAYLISARLPTVRGAQNSLRPVVEHRRG